MAVKTSRFSVAYGGPTVDDGTMPVHELAPSLLALGAIFKATSAAAYPDREPVNLSIRAVQRGSFLVALALEVGSLWDQAVDLFSGETATALTTMRDLVLASGGLFWLIRKVNGRKARKVDDPPASPDNVVIEIETDGKQSIRVEVPAHVWVLFQDQVVRERAAEFVRPLKHEGIDTITVRAGDHTEVISAGDVEAFDPRSDEEPVSDLVFEGVFLEVATASFRPQMKWRFWDGGATFAATIEDEGFLDRVARGEDFRTGDMLKCDLRRVQMRTPMGLRTTTTVTRVYEHVKVPEQLQMGESGVDAPAGG